MTDLVAIAVMRRQALRAEVESLDRFIGTAEWLLRGRAENARAEASDEARRQTRPIAEIRDTGRAAGTGEKSGEVRAGSTDSSLSGEWEVDTFHFEAVATAS